MFPFFCLENREKWARQVGHSSFDLVDLTQFRSTSFRTILSYLFMYIQLLITLAVYGSDIYTAVMLLAFSRWASSVTPYVPFHISRWIFGGCILFSFVLLFYDYIQAYRVWKRHNICLTYTNPICRTIYSIRGYNYFCLFAKITKSKKFTDLVALFVFFTFKGWANLLLAEGPRQVINGLTLYSVLKIDTDFVGAVKSLAQDSRAEAIVVSLMAFSLLIWIISMFFFLLAIFCSCSIWTLVKRSNCGSLEEYCCRRIDRRVARLVAKYHKRGLEHLAKENLRMSKQPTLPTIEFPGASNDSTFSVDSYGSSSYRSSFRGSNKGSYKTSLKGSSNTNLLESDQVAHDFYSVKNGVEFSLSDLHPYESGNTLQGPHEANETSTVKKTYTVPRKPQTAQSIQSGVYSNYKGPYQNSEPSFFGSQSSITSYNPPQVEARPMRNLSRQSSGYNRVDGSASFNPTDTLESTPPYNHDNLLAKDSAASSRQRLGSNEGRTTPELTEPRLEPFEMFKYDESQPKLHTQDPFDLYHR